MEIVTVQCPKESGLLCKHNVNYEEKKSHTALKFPLSSLQLPPALLRRVLLVLHKKTLPHMQNPCIMTDFLTDAYNKGEGFTVISYNCVGSINVFMLIHNNCHMMVFRIKVVQVKLVSNNGYELLQQAQSYLGGQLTSWTTINRLGSGCEREEGSVDRR